MLRGFFSYALVVLKVHDVESGYLESQPDFT
jgi:hypothetical protein